MILFYKFLNFLKYHNKEMFSKLVEQYNSFLAVMLFHIGDPESEIRRPN